MSAAEMARADASVMPDWLLELHQGGDLQAASSRNFVRKFADLIMTPAEQGAMFTKGGTLSQEGLTRFQNALFAKAFDDTELLTALR